MTATGTLENTATVDSDSDPNDSNDTDTDVDNLLVLGPCGAPTDRALANQVVVTQQVFEACESIEAGPNFRIGLFGDATFRVGIEIILKNGFSIESGAKFVAQIDASLSN